MKDEIQKIDRILNCLESREQENDWSAEDISDSLDSDEQSQATALPQSIDLREDWWEINDQKSTGSCVGWAVADVLRYSLVKSRRIPLNTPISARYLWMASKELDRWKEPATTFIELAGTSIKTALDVARRYGLVREQDLPFNGGLYPHSTKRFYALASRIKLTQYANLRQSANSWKTWLAHRGPILVRLVVDETFRNAAATNGWLKEYLPNTARGGHAIAIVGYNDKGFIIRNSWSDKWGKDGFAVASYAYAKEAFKEAYGVNA